MDKPVGRFAPSPTGRMHLGNIFTAYWSWKSVRQRQGRWILRVEDLDPQRSKTEYALLIEDDLNWLGLDWDEGGTAGTGPHGPYSQSLRGDIYLHYFEILRQAGLIYPCRCRRADIMASQAPHQADGRIIYGGTCRPAPGKSAISPDGCASRIIVPDEIIRFNDRFCGPQAVNLAADCGDFIVRRADKAWAYQLAVVVDDALMGVTEVMRGNDLLLSAAQQIFLFKALGFEPPEFAHLPLITNDQGIRLSKRDQAMSMETLRRTHTPSSLRQLLEDMGHRLGIAPMP